MYPSSPAGAFDDGGCLAPSVIAPSTTAGTAAPAATPDYPDVANVEWPQLPDPPVCGDPSGIQGVYTVQAGETEQILVALFGITVEELNQENPAGISYEAGEHINVCHTWFEG